MGRAALIPVPFSISILGFRQSNVNFRLQTIDIGGLCYTWLVIPSYFERLFEEVSVVALRGGFLDCE